MQIALILFTYFPYGGLQRDFLQILEACQQRGGQVTVYCMSWQGEIPQNITLIIPELKGFGRVAKRKKFVEYCLRSRKDKCKLVIGFNKMPGLDYYYAADSCFAGKAFDQRGWLYRLSPRCKQYLQYEEAVFSNLANTRVLYISPRQKVQYQKFYSLDDKRSVDLPPGISQDRRVDEAAAEKRIAFRKKFSLGNEDLLILQLGSGFAIKGVDRSLYALASLPDNIKSRVKYFLVGEGNPKKYLRLAIDLGVEHCFRTFPGQDDIPSFLQGADLLLHPAYQESAGLVLLEAIVAGLPVLTTDTCGFSFHVEKAKAGLVCKSPYQQQELNDLLLFMLTENLRKQWRVQGIEYGKSENLYDMSNKVAELLVPLVIEDVKE